MRYHTKPWKHQEEALQFLYPRNFGALYTDMGSGKTKVMIDLIVNRRFKTTLIIAPKKVCRVWAPQFLVHAPNEPISVVDVSKFPADRKPEAIRKSAGEAKNGQLIVVVNYDSVWREPFKKFLLKYKIDAVICDESHRIKSPSSKVSRFLQILGRRVSNRFLMTGTPLAQSPLDIYGQYRFLAPEIFGTSFSRFKDNYANQVPLPGGISVIDKRNPYKNLDDLRNKMLSCAFKVEVEQNLPPVQDIDVEFEIPASTDKYYKEIRREGVLALKEGYVEAANVLAILLRLQQLLSGYLPVTDEDGNKSIVQIDRARQEALRELLEDLPPDEPVVIFAKYKKDIKDIRRLIHGMGKKSSEVSGSRDTLHNWVVGKTQYLVVQISAGAEGIDLTRSRYTIYYTPDHSLSRYLQSRKRVHRPGQTRPVVYYKLVAKRPKGLSIDELIWKALANNEEITQLVMGSREI